MKKLTALLAALVVLTPAFALAQSPALRADVHANAQASTSAREPKLGPAIKAAVSSTRAEFKDVASSTSEMVRAKVEAIKSVIHKKREDNKKRADSARAKAHERFGAHVEQLVGNVSSRLASTSAKLDSIADRIDARIDAQQGEGHEMSDSITLLALARTDLSAANDKILAVNASLEAAMSTTTPKAQMTAVRAAVKAAEDALKLVKDDLMKTLRSVSVEAGATTTVSN